MGDFEENIEQVSIAVVNISLIYVQVFLLYSYILLILLKYKHFVV